MQIEDTLLNIVTSSRLACIGQGRNLHIPVWRVRGLPRSRLLCTLL